MNPAAPRILVIDNDAQMREMVADILVENGFVVQLANDVDEALRMLETDEVALVITDLRVSPRSGLDLVAKAGAIGPAPPTVLMTAFGEHEGKVLAENPGLAGFLRKPFRQDELLRLVSELLVL